MRTDRPSRRARRGSIERALTRIAGAMAQGLETGELPAGTLVLAQAMASGVRVTAFHRGRRLATASEPRP